MKITLCEGCYCMAKTIKGKCGYPKPNIKKGAKK